MWIAELRERKWNHILVKSEVDEVWKFPKGDVSVNQRRRGEAINFDITRPRVCSVNRASCLQSHNNPAKSCCLDFTNGGRKPERTEVLYFTTCSLTRLRSGTASVVFIISTYCDESEPGEWLLLSSQHLALETVNSSWEQKSENWKDGPSTSQRDRDRMKADLGASEGSRNGQLQLERKSCSHQPEQLRYPPLAAPLQEHLQPSHQRCDPGDAPGLIRGGATSPRIWGEAGRTCCSGSHCRGHQHCAGGGRYPSLCGRCGASSDKWPGSSSPYA